MQCAKCREEKPLNEFDVRGDNQRRARTCKSCRRSRVNANSERRYRQDPVAMRAKSAAWRISLRREVIHAYGGKCACCAETEFAFLALDHVDGDGSSQRRALGGNAYTIYLFVKRAGFPEGYQVLCHNCNIAKHTQGVCPHQTARLAVG